jgi:hypothetical protein
MTDGDSLAETGDAPQALWVRIVSLAAVAVVVPALLVSLVIVRYPAYSVLDEAPHADYLRRIEDLEVPRVGDRLLQETVADAQCRTIGGRRAQPCGLPEYDPGIMGAQGYQYEAQQPPLYYAITALLRQAARIGPVDSFLVSARLTGIVWLVAGLLVFFAACRRLGCAWWPSILVTLLLGVGPGVLYQSATVNNDAAAILTGSLALFMFAQLRDRVTTTAVVVWSVVAVALVMVKPTGVVAIGTACAALIVDALIDRRLTRRLAVAFVAPVLVGLVAYVGWSAIREGRATVDYDVVLRALLGFKLTDDVPLDDVSHSIGRLLGSYTPAGLPIIPPYVQAPALVVTWPFIAAAFTVFWVRRGGEVAQRLASVALLALLVGGPAFTLLFYFDYSVEDGPNPRYGLSLLPLLFVGGAATYRTRRGLAMFAALAVLLLGPLVFAINWPENRM